MICVHGSRNFILEWKKERKLNKLTPRQKKTQNKLLNKCKKQNKTKNIMSILSIAELGRKINS